MIWDFLSCIGLTRPTRDFWLDTALTCISAFVVATFSIWLFSHFDFDVVCRNFDVWFDSDPARVVGSLESRFSHDHSRSSLHPLWSIGATTPFIALYKLTNVGVPATVAAYVAFCAAAFGSSVFVALRMMRLGRFDSFLLLALGLSTTTAWFWLGFPELFILGGASVVIPLIWLAAPRGKHDVWSAPLQSLMSLSITITNWVTGLLAALLGLGWRRALHVTMVAFTLCAFLAFLQYYLFPESGAFFNIWSEKGRTYGETGGIWDHLNVFFLSSIAGPAPDLMNISEEGFKLWTLLDPLGDRAARFQFSSPTSSPFGIATLVLWGLLAARGIWIAARGDVDSKVALFVVGMIVFNAVMHAVYGIETFLYMPHVLPFFIFVAAWSLLPARGMIIVRTAILATIALGTIHNFALFTSVIEWHNSIPVDLVSHPRAVHTCQ